MFAPGFVFSNTVYHTRRRLVEEMNFLKKTKEADRGWGEKKKDAAECGLDERRSLGFDQSDCFQAKPERSASS